jgi:hypothetical protein
MAATFEAELNRQDNIVRTRFFGVVTAAHMAEALLEFQGFLPQLSPGFAILADLSGLESMELECAPPLARIMELSKARGVSMVVRVIPDPHKDIGLKILSIIHYGTGVRIVTLKTLAEGEQTLASFK